MAPNFLGMLIASPDRIYLWFQGCFSPIKGESILSFGNTKFGLEKFPKLKEAIYETNQVPVKHLNIVLKNSSLLKQLVQVYAHTIIKRLG